MESLVKPAAGRLPKLWKNTLGSRKGGFAALAAALALGAAALLAQAPAASSPDLAHGDPARIADLRAHWRYGDIIVLIRHVERCDRSDAPCLAAADGITVRASEVARALGSEFQYLGLGNADIYNSPLTRTRQTAEYMFGTANSTAQDWLYQCKGTMLRDMLEHKQEQRNLVLVTHSECFDALMHDLKLPDGTTPAYGSALFVFADKASGATQLLGHIDAADWREAFPR